MNPLQSAFGMTIDNLLSRTTPAVECLPRWAEQIRQWREEDRAAGIIWNDESLREREAGQQSPGE